MLSIKNILDFGVLENACDVYYHDQQVFMIGGYNTTQEWFYLITATEIIMIRADKKLRIVNHPLKNDAKWS